MRQTFHKRRSGTVSNETKKYNNQPVKEQTTIHQSGGRRERRERRRRRGGGGAKKNNTEERSAAQSPASFSLEKETKEPRPLPLLSLEYARKDPGPGGEAGGLVGVRDVAEEEHGKESK